MDWLTAQDFDAGDMHGQDPASGTTEPASPAAGDIDASWDRTRTAEVHRLFVEHHKSLLAFISRRMASPDEAHDIVQSAFVEAFRCYGRFSGASSMKTWLFGIALNVMRNHHFRSSWRHATPLDDDGLLTAGETARSPQEAYEVRCTVERVLRGLDAASPDHRDTLLLVAIDGLSYEAAAQRLGVAVGTVRSRVSRLRAALRDQCEGP
ncbi:MAG: hypothetical protein RJA99_3905 [Pseudomonadota bacterium]|jgi:RNA polymerase sigma factor (sigma-70 family)